MGFNPFKAIQQNLVERAFDAAEEYIGNADFDKNGEADVEQLKRVVAVAKEATLKFIEAVDVKKMLEALRLAKQVLSLVESAIDKGMAKEAADKILLITQEVTGYIEGVQESGA